MNFSDNTSYLFIDFSYSFGSQYISQNNFKVRDNYIELLQRDVLTDKRLTI